MSLYLIHSTVPLKRSNGSPVRHYLGYARSPDPTLRLEQHRRGRHSAAVVQAFLRAGGELHLGQVWPEGTPQDERRLKRNGHLQDHCLICKLEAIHAKVKGLPK